MNYLKKYDPKDKFSIYNYAKKMIGKSFHEIVTLNNIEKGLLKEPQSIYNSKHKGNLGEIIEEYYFDYKPDNLSQADFPEAQLELKVTPFKTNKNKTISAKERLSITMINFDDIIKDDFYDSVVWNKIMNILLVYYEWTKEIDDNLEYIINFVHLYQPTTEDLEIIIQDYRKIQNKVKLGLAHEISEGDTLYLGAAPKGSNSKDLTTQPYSDIKAMRRGFAFKNSYMTYLLRNTIKPQHDLESVLKNERPEDFEQYILDKINKYSKYTTNQLFKMYFNGGIPKAKHKYSMLIYRMLGVKSKNIEEFEKANIIVKTIRREKDRSVRESLSFPKFNIMELINENWDDSYLNMYFRETKFLFVVFDKIDDDYELTDSMFWNMPEEIIDTTLKSEYIRAKNKFKEGVILNPVKVKNGYRVYNNLPAISNTDILHVRPHAQKSLHIISGVAYGNGSLRDTDLLPNGDRMTNQCFWINHHYLAKIINKI